MLCTTIASTVQKDGGRTFEGVGGKYRKGLHASTSTSTMAKKSSLLPRDSRPVGLESKVEGIKRMLEEPQVTVIAVVGMGGSGKTFLLQNVYKAVKFKYDHYIWLSISKSYSLKNLQHDIASHIGLRKEIVDGEVSEERAAELIQEHLEGKRCLIVLDDLWTLSTENSLIDKLGLPGAKDCKVVVTTRNRQVALLSGARIYEMQNLSDEDGWRLFCVYAFPHCGGNRAPPNMEEEGRRIVKKCGNLPLAIKTIAASLANTALEEWEFKRRQLERVITPIADPDPNPIMEILKLSYDSLPEHLKPCFAYLSFFPENAKIKAEYLLNLWIGEGFVPAGEEQWNMAWDWLGQLAQVCLLQVYAGSFNYDFSTMYCEIHDLLHDLAINISKTDQCIFSVEELSSLISGSTARCRILLPKKGLHVVNAISESRPLYLRTLSLSQNLEITSIPENLFTTMRGLRVLDLSHTSISALPASLGKMILLKVLDLRDTKVSDVPKCVRHLKSLLFLAFPESCKSLPVWISELKNLKHLEGWGIDRIPREMKKLGSLITLRSHYLHLSTEEEEFMRLEDLVDMTALHELWLIVKHETELKRIEEGILAQLVKIRCLEMRNEVRELVRLPEKMRAMKDLRTLSLHRFVVPSWMCELRNLRELWLAECECSCYPELQRMPNLVSLLIKGNGRCRELPKVFGRSEGFQQLRFLTIADFSSLEEFPEFEEGAMACLKEFNLSACPKLKKLEGLERLKRLESFHCFGCSKGMKEWLETLSPCGEGCNPHVVIKIDS